MKNRRASALIQVIMKITFVQIVLALSFAMSAYCKGAGAQDLLDKEVTINIEQKEIKKVLHLIKDQTGIQFIYSSKAIPLNSKVSLEADHEKLGRVLNQLLKPFSIQFAISDGQIVLYSGALEPKETSLTGNGKINLIQTEKDRELKGKVYNSKGEPVSGASVMIKGSNLGTITDASGSFAISVPNENVVLLISSVGYENLEVPVSGKSLLEITLVSLVSQMDQVVVVGYGTQKRSQVVGSISSLSGSEIAKQPVLSAAQGLQGKTSGVQIISSGAPGSQPQVRIRGTNTVTGNPNPVYVVDGVITDDIRNVSTTDIASVEVLKDASSQAIYGSRGSNGVILISTKSGRQGKTKITADSYFGFRAPTSIVKMADARTYANFSNEARSYDNQPALFNPDTLKYNTDWFREITQNGIVQNHVVSISGGSEKTTYYFSGAYFKDEGIMKGNDYSRWSFRLNNEYRLASFLKFGHNLNLSVSNTNNKPNEFTDAYRNAPTTPVYFSNGNYGYLSALSVGNPVASLNYTNDRSGTVRLLGNVYGELTPLKGFTLRSSLNFDRNDDNSLSFTPAYLVWSNQQNDSSRLNIGTGRRFFYIVDNNATYRKTIAGNHDFNVMVGYSAERDYSTYLTGFGKGVPLQKNLWYLEQSNPNTRTLTNGGAITTRASLYSRLTYTFDNKYNLSGVFRNDGSSNFPPSQKWGTFYSAGASWIVTKENFMKHQQVFEVLKIRMGYGKIGNDRIASGSALNPVTTISNAYSFGGDSYPVVPGITINKMTNAAFSWETTAGLDAGIEFSMLHNRLTGDVSYYNKLTNAYIPVTVGGAFGDASNVVISQAADVRNKGMEWNLRWNGQAGKDFNYFIGGNITINTNNIEKVNGALLLKGGSLGNGEVTTYTVTGQPIGSFWVYNAVGIFRDSAQLASTPHITGAKKGDLIFADTNKDGVINDKDRIFVGSYQPKAYFGLNIGFNWKNLDFSMDCYGNTGNKIYNGKKAIRLGNDNIEEARATDRWSPANPNGSQPRASNTIPKPSTYFVESGDFLRINNLTLGYTIPPAKWNNGISRLRFFASAQNPFIWKKFTGYTPELPAASAINSGIELGIYPITSTYMAGVNLSF